MNFSNLLQHVQSGSDLEISDMEYAISEMMDGKISEDSMADFLLALKEKGEAVAELVGAARAMRSKMAQITSNHSVLVDTCGTGGDGSGTFNISTAAAIVAAASGVPIAKHGNRAISSKSGSADALKELGVNVEASKACVENCLQEIGLCFCFAPLFHESVKNVGAARKKLGVPTIFNMLGPLCNPAGAGFQMIGVGKAWQRPLIAAALQKLGTTRSVVVHGRDGICEVSNADSTEVSIVSPEKIEEAIWSPADFGLTPSTRGEITVETPVQSAELIRSALSGKPGGARDIVILNAAAAMWLVNNSQSLQECAAAALDQIESQNAIDTLKRLIECSQIEP